MWIPYFPKIVPIFPSCPGLSVTFTLKIFKFPFNIPNFSNSNDLTNINIKNARIDTRIAEK